MRLQIGSSFADYTVESLLGRGGMATVYLVRETGINRLVALKLLPEQLTDDRQFAERFQQEAQVIGGLDHPNIIPLYRCGITDDMPWMALRYVEGGDMAARMTAQPLLMAEGLSILRGVAAALDYAHRKGVIHRDLKPHNILLTADGAPYLADFGIAKLFEGASKLKTATGGLLGTPAYMAPEQARGLKLGPYTDVYALAVICFQWLAGSLPFDADTPHAILIKHVMEPVPLDLLNLLPSAVAAVLERGLAKQPEDRFASASSLIAALELAQLPPRVEMAPVSHTEVLFQRPPELIEHTASVSAPIAVSLPQSPMRPPVPESPTFPTVRTASSKHVDDPASLPWDASFAVSRHRAGREHAQRSTLELSAKMLAGASALLAVAFLVSWGLEERGGTAASPASTATESVEEAADAASTAATRNGSRAALDTRAREGALDLQRQPAAPPEQMQVEAQVLSRGRSGTDQVSAIEPASLEEARRARFESQRMENQQRARATANKEKVASDRSAEVAARRVDESPSAGVEALRTGREAAVAGIPKFIDPVLNAETPPSTVPPSLSTDVQADEVSSVVPDSGQPGVEPRADVEPAAPANPRAPDAIATQPPPTVAISAVATKSCRAQCEQDEPVCATARRAADKADEYFDRCLTEGTGSKSACELRAEFGKELAASSAKCEQQCSARCVGG